MKVADQVVWLTGASSGMGEQLAYQLCAKGAKLVLSSRRKEALEVVKSKCKGKYAQEIAVVPLDLAQPETLAEKAKEVYSSMGRVDVLINNGGISQRSLVSNTSMEVYRKIMQVDFFAAVQLSKLVLPHMLKQKRGRHVVITSATGIISTPYRSAYAAAKHALHGFYDALHAETFDQNVKVTLICPGFVQTQVSYNALTGEGNKRNEHDRQILNGMTAEKAARKIIFALEKDKAEYCFGGFTEMAGIYLKRFLPGVYARMVRGYVPN
jgi:short-subunit dehydrogenase